MRALTRARQFAEVLVIVAVLALVAGQALGQPILLSYVETGSMEPTMAAGDGFVAVPTAIAGPVERGDVVVFRAERLQGGGLTTHRVVGETESGFVTQGDANPFTDQDGNEPPVQRAQVVAKALQVGGSVVVVPNLGTAILTLRGGAEAVQRGLGSLLGTRSLLGTGGLSLVLFGVTALAYLLDVLLGDDGGLERSTDRTRESGVNLQYVFVGLALVIVLTATAAMVVPGGQQRFEVISSDTDAPGPRVIPSGETERLTYRVPNAGLVPVQVYLEPQSEGIAVDRESVFVSGRGNQNATVSLTAPPETGYYRRFLVEHRYLAILPEPMLSELHQLHPWLPVVVIDCVLGGTFYLLGAVVVGTGRVRRRRRRTSRSEH